MQSLRQYITQIQRISAHRSYRRLLIGGLVSALGDRAGYIAFLAAVTAGNNDALAVGGITIAETLPVILAAPIVSYFVDRYDRRQLMLLADLIRSIVFSAAFFYPEIWVIYVVGFISAAFTALFEPSRLALEPHYVPPGEITQANGLRMSMMSFVMICGPAIGGLLVSTIGYRYAFLFNAVSFLFSAWMVARLDAVPLREQEAGTSKWSEMIGGFQAVKSNTILVYLFALFGAFMLVIGIQFPLIYVFVTEQLHGGPKEAGWLFSAVGIGGLIGGALIASLQKKAAPFDAQHVKGRGQIAGLVLLDGLIVIVFASLHSLWAAAGTFVIFGAIGTALNTALQSAITLQSREEERGRIFTFYSTIAGPLMVVSIAIGTPFARTYGSATIFYISGGLEVLVGLLAYRIAQRFSGGPPQTSVEHKNAVLL